MGLRDSTDGVSTTYVPSPDLTSSCSRLTTWILVSKFMVDLSSENLRKLEVKPLHSSPCLHLLDVQLMVVVVTLHLLHLFLVTLTTITVVVVIRAASERLPLSWLELVKLPPQSKMSVRETRLSLLMDSPL